MQSLDKLDRFIRQNAFMPPPCTYSERLPYFRWFECMARRVPVIHITAFPSRPTILYSHGNAEDIGQLVDWLYVVSQELRVNVCAYDYYGYGLNRPPHNSYPPEPVQEGPPCLASESHCFLDAEAVFVFLTEELRIPKRSVVLWGRSIGSGPSCELAAKYCRLHAEEMGLRRAWGSSLFNMLCVTDTHDEEEAIAQDVGRPLAGVVLQCPVASAIRVVSKALAMFGFYFDIMNNVKKMGDITVPITVIHGRRDEIVPYEHGEQLHRLAGRYAYPMLSLDQATHNDIEALFSPQLLDHLRGFLAFVTEDSTPNT